MAVESTDERTEKSGLSAGLCRLTGRSPFVEFPGEEGPNGRKHYPSYGSGCYYGRPANCCTYCYLRLAAAVF